MVFVEGDGFAKNRVKPAKQSHGLNSTHNMRDESRRCAKILVFSTQQYEIMGDAGGFFFG